MGSWTAVVAGKLPTLNDLLRPESKRARNAVKQRAQARVAAALREAGVPALRAPVRVAVDCYEPSRNRDKDNVHAFACKVALDALQREGVLENDNWKWCPELPGGGVWLDRERPRVEITVEGDER